MWSWWRMNGRFRGKEGVFERDFVWFDDSICISDEMGVRWIYQRSGIYSIIQTSDLVLI
jgi:hypothetical protein